MNTINLTYRQKAEIAEQYALVRGDLRRFRAKYTQAMEALLAPRRGLSDRELEQRLDWATFDFGLAWNALEMARLSRRTARWLRAAYQGRPVNDGRPWPRCIPDE